MNWRISVVVTSTAGQSVPPQPSPHFSRIVESGTRTRSEPTTARCSLLLVAAVLTTKEVPVRHCRGAARRITLYEISSSKEKHPR